MEKKYFIHETSLIGSDTIVGKNTRIWQFCNIMNNVIIGRNCNIGSNVFIESGVQIGNDVKIKNNISIYKGVVCEDGVFLGPSCVFTNVINPRGFINKKDEFKQTIVKYGATIGANATIVCGNIIGSYAMVGAGSVVTKDIGDYELVMGNPAKKRGYVCQCGEKLIKREGKFFCQSCGKQYKQRNNTMIYEGEENGVH